MSTCHLLERRCLVKSHISKLYTGVGTCFVTDYETGPFEANKKIDFKITMQVTGSVVETVA